MELALATGAGAVTGVLARLLARDLENRTFLPTHGHCCARVLMCGDPCGSAPIARASRDVEIAPCAGGATPGHTSCPWHLGVGFGVRACALPDGFWQGDMEFPIGGAQGARSQLRD